jgi:hypothetical protein
VPSRADGRVCSAIAGVAGGRVTVETVASLGVAVGTIFLAIVAWLQVGASKGQVRASKEQVGHAAESLKATEQETAATERAAEATEAATQEAVRARVDAMSFRVVAEMAAPGWPPIINPRLRAMPGGGEPTMFDERNVRASRPLEPGEAFAFPKQEDELLWFKTFGLLRNEGHGSAFIALPANCRIPDGNTPFGEPTGRTAHPRQTGEFNPRLVLEPGRWFVFPPVSERVHVLGVRHHGPGSARAASSTASGPAASRSPPPKGSPTSRRSM